MPNTTELRKCCLSLTRLLNQFDGAFAAIEFLLTNHDQSEIYRALALCDNYRQRITDAKRGLLDMMAETYEED